MKYHLFTQKNMLKKCRCGDRYETTWQDANKGSYVYKRKKNVQKIGNNTCTTQKKRSKKKN